MLPSHLLIRADASSNIGVGHIMRMIALAQAWQQRGGTVSLVASECPEPLVRRLRSENMRLTKLTVSKPGSPADADATARHAIQAKAAAVVVDGYIFDEDYQFRLNRQIRPLLVVDDYCHFTRYHCDLILDQNLDIAPAAYASRGSAAQVLSGPKYALLRNEFQEHHAFERDFSDARRLLVTLGGSRTGFERSILLPSLKLLSDLRLETRVLIGATEDCEELESVATDLPHLSIIPYVSDMSAQYRWADIAIAGGGSSNWEMCLFGLPRLVVVLAENQRQVAGQLAEYGSALNLGPAAELTSEMVAQSIRGLVSDMSLRESLSSRSKTLVDGYGAKRVVDQLMWANLRTSELTLAAEGLQIRPATWADSGLLLNWRNDSSTRIASRNHAEITPERHQQWLRETLSGQTRRLFIAETDRAPVGTIRLDFADEVEISWTVAPASRGAGWGKKMVMLVAESVNCDLVACVRTENVASQKIAEAAGFKTAGQHDNMLIYRRSS